MFQGNTAFGTNTNTNKVLLNQLCKNYLKVKAPPRQVTQIQATPIKA
jgi:hypothetical protein